MGVFFYVYLLGKNHILQRKVHCQISRKISMIFYKIVSPQVVKPSKFERYSAFPAVNSSKPSFTTVGREFTAEEGSSR
jgi:hypothetical protein